MAKTKWIFEPTDRWIRAEVDGVVVADSKSAMLMVENPGELNYYFPRDDVRQDLLQLSDKSKTSGYRGRQRFWHIDVNGRLIENAAWTYEPQDGRPDLSDYIALKWPAMDHWYEESEEIFHHPRNPYHRVDTLPSSRHVQVFVDDRKVADSKRPYLLFETNLPTRYYIPIEDVEQQFLEANDTHSICPYKGTASYYDLKVNADKFDDVVWHYPDPIAEAPKLKGKVAFWAEKDKRIRLVVDGEQVA